MKRGPTFEVVCNRAGFWYVRERAANGEIVSHTEAYSRKWSAKRAAIRKVAQTIGSRWKFV